MIWLPSMTTSRSLRAFAVARFDTADFSEPPGNLRADHVLPSKNLPVTAAGVFWPVSSDPLSALTGTYPFPSSDQRLVWIDAKQPHRA